MIMVLPVMVNAQFTAIFGNGTSASTLTGSPMSYGGVYSYSEQIYRAAELTAAGVPAGAVITTIAFYNATGATTMSDLRTYMGHRSMMNYSSTTDWTPFSTLVQVDSGDWVTTGVGWFDIQLDQPFVWNGVDNLVVAVSFRGVHSDYSTNNPNCGYQYTTQSENSALRRYSTSIASCDPASTAAASTNSTSRPNLRIAYIVSGCPSLPPSVANIGLYSAGLNWVNYNQSALSFDLVYGMASTFDTLTGTILTGITDTFHALTGLTSATTYKACIKAHCSSENGTWSIARSFTTLAACPTPTQLAVDTVNAYGATVTWTPGASETSWELMCVPHGTAMSAGISGYPTSSTYQITNLTPATTYDVYVRADCGLGEYSYWTAATTFTTSCLPLTTLPFTENFDSYAGTTAMSVSVNNLPTCWSYLNNGTSTSYSGYPIIYDNSAYAATGTKSMRFYTWTTAAYDNQMAILPAIDPITYPINTLQISFDARDETAGYPFVLVVGILSDPTDATTFVPVDTIQTSSTVYANYEVPLTNYTGTGSYIGIVAKKPASGYNYGFVDNIIVDIASNCSRPSNVALENITASSVMVDWTPADTETEWQVAVVPYGQNLSNAIPEQVYTHPYIVSSLTDDTPYSVYVRSVCPTSGFSSWTSPVSFRTDPLCTPPTNMTVSQIKGTSALVSWNSAPVGAHSYMVEYSEHNMNNWVPATVAATQYMLSGLIPQTNYDVRVYSNCQSGVADTVNETFMTGCISGGEMTIGSGTMTSEFLPSYSYCKYGYSQQLYTAAELGGGSTLNSIAFHLSTLAQQRIYTIYLMHTTATSLSSGWIPTTGAQQVFSGAHTLVQGWNTFNFTTPFQYNGTDNLLVIVLDGTGSYTQGNMWYTHGATGLARHVYGDGSSYTLTPPSDSGALANERNNVKFGSACDNAVTCADPNAYVTDVTASSITVDWAPGNTETSWQMEYSTDGVNWTPEGSVTAPHTITSLNANTNYSIRLRSDCGGSYGYWRMVHAHTPCSSASIPLLENFDNASGSVAGNMVDCWGTLTNFGSAYPYASTLYHHSGTHSAYFYGANAYHSILVSPRLEDTVQMNNLQLSFYAYKTSANYYIQVGVMSDPTDANTFVQVGQNISPSSTSTWQFFEVNTSYYTGQGRYIAFRVPQDISNYMYIDDINIHEIPGCPHVENLHVSNVGSTTATIVWTAGGNESSWEVYIIEGTDSVNLDTVTPISVTETTYVATTLYPGTPYTVYVRGNCGDGGHTSLFVAESFQTSCMAMTTLPYVENFDSYSGTTSTSTSVLPICWSSLNGGTSYAGLPTIYNSTTYAHSGSNSLYFCTYPTSGSYADQYAILPEIDVTTIPMNTLQLSMSARPYSTSYPFVIQVGVMTNPMQASTFQLVETITVTGSSYQTMEAYFNNFTGNGGYVALKVAKPASGYNYGYIDDVVLSQVSSCSPVSNLQVSDVAGSSALLTWNEGHFGTPAYYTVEYAESGLDNWLPASYSITTTSYMLGGLYPSTAYDVRVKAYCNDNSESDTVVAHFTTGCLAGGNVTIGDGTYINSFFPCNSCYNYCLTEQLYTSSEIDGAGNITSISFNASTVMSTPRNWAVYLMPTTQTSLTGFVNMGATAVKVYEGPVNITQGWFTINFTTPFPYDGSSNLILAIDDNTGSYLCSNSFYNHTNPNGSSYYYYVDNASSNPNPSSATSCSPASINYRADIIFGMPCDSNAMCVVPNMYVNNVTSATADVNWVPGYMENAWEMEYALYGDSIWTPVFGVWGDVVTLSNLTPSTHYQVRMRSDCGDGDMSSWITRDFKTECDIFPIPFSENFNNIQGAGSNNAYPDCWTRDNNYNDMFAYPYVITAESGSLYFYANSSTYNIAVTPELNTAMNLLTVSFDLRTGSLSNGIVVGVMDDPDDLTGFVPVDTVFCTATNVMQSMEVYLDSYTGNGEYLAFMTYTPNGGGVYLDNVVIDMMPTCKKPSNLTVQSATQTTVQLTWTEGGAATSWNVEYGITGFTPGTGTIVSVQNTPTTTISGLMASTTYDFYVQADCGSGDVSSWSIKATGATQCGMVTVLPYTENFDSYGTGTTAYPNCWGKINTYSSEYPFCSSSYGYNGSMGALLFYTAGTMYNIAITPEFDATIPVNTLKATFMFRGGITISGYVNAMQVGVMTNPMDASTFVPVDTVYAGSSVTTYESCEVSFANYTGTGHFIAFRNGLMGGNYQFAVMDNLVISVDSNAMPLTCQVPTGLSVGNVAQTTATANWTAGDTETAWDLQYKQHSASIWGDTIPLTAHTYNFTGLTASTQYDVRVRANCGSNNISDWTNTVTFTTEPDGIADYEHSVSLYPNPNNGRFTINNEQLIMNDVQVYDVYGKLLKTIEADANTVGLDVRELSAGMYFVRISTEKGVVTKSFVKK